jgi:hypothetical protein
VYERRQRSCLADAGAALGAGVVAFGILAAGACTPVAPTATGSGPTSTPEPAAAQGPIQAAATAVSPQVQYITQVLTSILGGGVQLELEQQPPDVANTQVTNVRLRATDASGAFAGLDRDGREKTAEAVLFATSQFYPQATVDLLVVDGSNRTLMTGSRAPGQPAKLDD